MVVELLEYVGSRLKELNPYVEAYAVNALRLSNGKVAKLSGKKDFEYAGISDLNKAGFYIRLTGKPRYSPRKARTSENRDNNVFVPVRLVFYSIDTDFEGSRIENKLTNDLIKFNFSGYTGNARSPKFVIVQTSYDAISVFEEETGLKFASNERPVIVSIDANLSLIMAENACNDFCDVYEILCGQTSPPVPNPDTPPMQTFCEAVSNCPVITEIQEELVQANDDIAEIRQLIGGGLRLPAGEILGGDRAVWLNNGSVFLFDPSNPACQMRYVGITKTSALLGDDVEIAFDGLYNSAGMGLNPGDVYYAGANGVLTSTPPAGIVQSVGVSQTANKIYLYNNLSIETV